MEKEKFTEKFYTEKVIKFNPPTFDEFMKVTEYEVDRLAITLNKDKSRIEVADIICGYDNWYEFNDINNLEEVEKCYYGGLLLLREQFENNHEYREEWEEELKEKLRIFHKQQ